MISRIYIAPKKVSTKADSYLIDSKLSKKELIKLAEMLTNPTLEDYFINESPKINNYQCAIEIGFLPGVTDNVGHTVKEIATDLLHLKKDFNFNVYTSKIFFIKEKEIEKVREYSLTLYNPLIERANIVPIKSNKINLPNEIPKVILKKKKPVISVSLDVEDAELIEIGEKGIKNEDGSRRGPLALDLSSMKVIKEYFSKLKRNPTDIELESLAQTWSEHCKHTIFANPIDDIKDGLYKTYIKGATNLIRKQKGKDDFCIF